MVQRAIETDTGFGIVLLKSGEEVHSEEQQKLPEIYSIGTMAAIRDYELLANSRYRIRVEGSAKIRVVTSWEQDDHLRMGQVQVLLDEPTLELRESDKSLAVLIEKAYSRMSSQVDYEPKNLADPSWVGMRLAELLPFDVAFRQRLLELNNAYRRLDLILEWFQEHS